MEVKKKKLLVLGSQRADYVGLFRGCLLGEEGIPLEVDHATWSNISICSYGDEGGLVVTIRPSAQPIPFTNQHLKRHFHPDFVLLRAGTRGDARTNYEHLLATLMHSSVPCLNSPVSFWVSQNKALLYGRLLEVKKKLGGADNFPLISQTCYSDRDATGFPPDFPAVAKIGTASGGLGKMKIASPEEWDDFCSVTSMQPQFFTSEKFIKWKYDIRIQKIGNHYRAFRRICSNHWKSNVDYAMKDEDIPLEPRYRTWIDAACEHLGMEISAMDVLQTEDGEEYILELNSSAIGFCNRYNDEDAVIVRDLTLVEMEKAFGLTRRQEREGERGLGGMVEGMVGGMEGDDEKERKKREKERKKGEKEEKKEKKKEEKEEKKEKKKEEKGEKKEKKKEEKEEKKEKKKEEKEEKKEEKEEKKEKKKEEKKEEKEEKKEKKEEKKEEKEEKKEKKKEEKKEEKEEKKEKKEKKKEEKEEKKEEKKEKKEEKKEEKEKKKEEKEEKKEEKKEKKKEEKEEKKEEKEKKKEEKEEKKEEKKEKKKEEKEEKKEKKKEEKEEKKEEKEKKKEEKKEEKERKQEEEKERKQEEEKERKQEEEKEE